MAETHPGSFRGEAVCIARALLMLVVSLALIACPIAKTAQERDVAEETFSASVADADEALAGLSERIMAARPVLEDITEEKLEEDDVRQAASDALDRAETVNAIAVDDDTDGRTTDELEQAASLNYETAAEAEKAEEALREATEALETAYVAQLGEDISAALEEAQSVHDSSDGWVGDDERGALQEAIEAASADGMGYPEMEDALAALTAETSAVSQQVNEAKEAARKAEEEAARAAAASASAGRSSSGTTSSASGSSSGETSSASTWYVSYTYFYGGDEANADGTLAEWKDGYFVAHNWSYSGIMIASKPTYVIVDGVTYRYVSSITVARGTTWGEVSGFVLANGGIGFQTCQGSGYLITHYEPV